MKVSENVLEAIGNTSIIKLNRVVPPDHAKVFVKLESENPTGSMKDRMAQAMIAEAEKDGRLNSGVTVIEYTGGSTGSSLALICAVKGYNLHIVSSDAFSQDKINHMKALGANMTIIPSYGRGTTKELIEEMIETARRLNEGPNTYWTDQFNNRDSITGYHSLGKEILEQTNGKISSFVHSVGTAASIKGISSILRNYNSDVKIIAVEPTESPVLSGGQKGAHSIEGIGSGFIPPMWESSIADTILQVSSKEAKEMARKLAKKEGILAGISSGANVAAAIKVAKELEPEDIVVTLIVDSGLKYMSTNLYK